MFGLPASDYQDFGDLTLADFDQGSFHAEGDFASLAGEEAERKRQEAGSPQGFELPPPVSVSFEDQPGDQPAAPVVVAGAGSTLFSIPESDSSETELPDQPFFRIVPPSVCSRRA